MGRKCCPIGQATYELDLDLKKMVFSVSGKALNRNWNTDPKVKRLTNLISTLQIAIEDKKRSTFQDLEANRKIQIGLKMDREMQTDAFQVVLESDSAIPVGALQDLQKDRTMETDTLPDLEANGVFQELEVDREMLFCAAQDLESDSAVPIGADTAMQVGALQDLESGIEMRIV